MTDADQTAIPPVEDGRAGTQPPLPGPLRLAARLPVHPVLLAAWSVVVVWAGNVSEVPPGDAVAVLGQAVVGMALLWVLCAGIAAVARVPGPLRRGAVAATVIGGGLLVAGRVAADASLAAIAVGVVAVAVVGMAVAVWAGHDTIQRLNALATIFTLVAVVMAVVPLVRVLALDGGEVAAPSAGSLATRPPERDIWYIIPDRYPRADTAAELYGFDNGPFLSALEQRGFTVQDQARANYPKTAHSLAATWNFELVQDLVPEPPDDPADWGPLYELLDDHRLGRVVTDAGMDYVHVGTWWSPTSTAVGATSVFDGAATSEFAGVWRDTTILHWLAEDSDQRGEGQRAAKYELARAQMAELQRLARVPAARPRLVLAHITVPHEPHVFDADGTFVDEATEASRPRGDNIANQVTWLNGQLLDLVDQLVTGNSATDPIIVVQSDEGPHPPELALESRDWADIGDAGRAEKLRTLSAWLVPGTDDVPPEDITGVNTWRWILDRELGTGLGLVEDRVFVYPRHAERYVFEEVTGDFD